MAERIQRYWTDEELDEVAVRLIREGEVNLEHLLDSMMAESNLQHFTVGLSIKRVANIDESRRVQLKPEVIKKLEAKKLEGGNHKKPSRA